MKRIIISLTILIILATSCNKALDTVPPGALVPLTSYTTDTQIKTALSGMYYNLRSAPMYSKEYTPYLTNGTDESYFYNTNYGYNTYAYAGLASTDPDITAFWKACYQAINYCNTFLDNVDASAATGSADAATVRKAKGEALFLRGYYYFLLAQWYGDIPLQIHASTDPSQGQIARTPVAQVYDQIISDMTAAEGMLYDQTFATNGNAEKVCVTTVEGILARVCLYAAGVQVNETQRFADARTWALKAINSGQHSLVASYQQTFIDEIQNAYNSENMWEVGFNQYAAGTISAGGQFSVYAGISKSTGTITPGTTATVYDGYDYGYVKPYARLYVSYQPGDLRRDWTISNYGWSGLVKTYYTANQIWSRYPAKWRRDLEPDASRLTQTSSQTNFPLLRYSDVLLMFAEAENEVNGPTTAAYNAVNLVRQRAFSATPIVNSVTVTAPGSGYLTAPAITFVGGGSGAAAFGTLVNKSVTLITVTAQGSGYTTSPILIVGTPWAANTVYAVNTQVISGGRVYTVTTAGTSTTTAPTNTSGASAAATTGAVFTFAGTAATAIANLTTPNNINLPGGLSQSGFRAAIQNERYLEFAFEGLRKADLKRWGLFISTVQSLAVDVESGATNPNWTMPVQPILSEITAAGSDLAPVTPALNIGTKDLYWPIPQYDLLLNFKLTQNPGY